MGVFYDYPYDIQRNLHNSESVAESNELVDSSEQQEADTGSG